MSQKIKIIVIEKDTIEQYKEFQKKFVDDMLDSLPKKREPASKEEVPKKATAPEKGQVKSAAGQKKKKQD